jgi:tetratricopeptide (TPR) repeat protein
MSSVAGAVVGLAVAVAVAAAARADAASEAPEPRTLVVHVAIDEVLRSSPRWRVEFERALVEASRVLGAPTGLRFVAGDVVPWSPARGSVEALLDDLRAHRTIEAGAILAGLTTRGRVSEGLSSYREACLVVVAPVRPRFARLLVHELGHLFGGVHLPGDTGLLASGNPGLSLDPLNAALVALHGRRSFDPRLFPLARKEQPRALELYRRAVEAGAPEARMHVAQILLEQGDAQEALTVVEAFLQGAPRDIEALNLRGIALRRLGRPAEAVVVYDRALAVRPRHASLHFNRAIALDRLGGTEEAARAYERAIDLEAGHVLALSNLARLHARAGDAPRALECGRRAVTLAPDFPEARVNLSMAHLVAREPDLAEAEARRALELDGELVEAHEALGAALLAEARAVEAVAAFAQALRRRPQESRLRRHLATAELAVARQRAGEGDEAAAGEALEAALERAPEETDILAEVAEQHFAAGRAALARDAYRRLLARSPDDAAAHNNLAVILFREGDVEEARQHAARAERLGLALHPDFAKALEAAGPRPR